MNFQLRKRGERAARGPSRARDDLVSGRCGVLRDGIPNGSLVRAELRHGARPGGSCELRKCKRIRDACDDVSAVTQQLVGPLTLWRVNRTWHGRDIATEIDGVTGCDQRTTLRTRFHHDRETAQTGDYAIATREAARKTLGAGREFRHDDTDLRDLIVERCVRAGIHDIDSGTEHRSGDTSSVKCGAVRDCIDAERQSADYARAGRRKCGR